MKTHVFQCPHLNHVGGIDEAGKYVKEIGSRPLVIGGEKALKAVWQRLTDSLKDEDIESGHPSLFEGYPSQAQFFEYAVTAKKNNCDVIIGIGGGRVLDTAKAAGDITGLPVVTIPTVAATCAAWAAVTIEYDDDGAFVRARWNKRSPQLVIADPQILLTAPVRYLYSGIVDTFAKWYENRPSLKKYADNNSILLSVEAARIAFEKLERYAQQSIYEAEENQYGEAARETIDAIIYLAGFAGSLQEGISHYGFAHPFYHISTRLPNTRIKLHGEKVAFGITAQLFLEKADIREIEEAIRLFDKYHAAFTLEDLGIKKTVEQDLDFLKFDVKAEFPYVTYETESIKRAMLSADALTQKIRYREAEDRREYQAKKSS